MDALASGAGSRAAKYRHLLDEAIGLGRDEQAVLCVLMLRGPQTPGELKGRTERMHPFADLAAIEDVLGRLGDRGLAARLERRPGQKEDRFAQRLGGDEEPELAPAAAPASAPAPAPADDLPARVAQLERAVAELRAEVEALRD